MRKCLSCGYLVLGDGDCCKHCGAPLPSAVAAGALATAGTPAIAAALATPPPLPAPPIPPVPPTAPRAVAPAPMPAAPIAPVPAAPPIAASPTFDRLSVGREYWTPPAPAPVRGVRVSPRAALALVCIVSMALGWVVFERVFSGNQLPPGTSAFVAGHGVAYSSPDHSFDARFPATPTVERRQIPIAESSATINLAQVQTDDYEVVAGSMVLPIAIPQGDVGPALHKILDAAVTAEGAKVVNETQVTQDGVPGLELRAKVQDGYDARFTMLISGAHIYMLGAHAKHGTDQLYDALLASLVMY